MKIVNLRLRNFYEVIGIDKSPVISWEYDGDGAFAQSGYRVSVRDADGIIYDSGYVISDEARAVCRMELRRHTRYFYSVEVSGADGEVLVSDTESFVTGIVGGWSAKWISSGGDKAFYAARRFAARDDIAEAFCSLCGLGQFVLSVNGKKVGDHVLDPGWTDYNKQVQYVTFDVTELLQRGENDIMAEIGCGWYLADIGGRHFYTAGFHGYQSFGRVLPFIFEMTVRYADGTEETLVSNEGWSVRRSATTLSNIYGSEDFDARLLPKSGSVIDDPESNAAVVLSSDDIPKGEVVAMSHPPVKIVRTYDAVSASERDGTVIYDFGQNMSGLFEITVRGKRGQRIKMTPVEKLTADGDICQSCDSYLIYTLGSEEIERWRPQFTYSAGRWVKVECLPADGEEETPQLLDIKAHFITSSAAVTGKFSCSDERCGQIMNIIERAIDSNLNHVHTDCPTVERLGWMETSHLMAPSVMYYRDAGVLWEKILRDARETQYGEGEEERDLTYTNFKYGEGMITSVAPRYARFVHAGDMGSFWDIVPWGSTVILGELQRRRFYGACDADIEAYEAAKKYLLFLKKQYDEYAEIYGRDSSSGEKFLRHGLGDWGVLRVGTEARENVETAFFYHDLDVMAKEAERLGRTDDAECFRRIADEVKDDYNRALLGVSESTGEYYYRMYGDTERDRVIQTVEALPLYFGMVPEDKRESVEASFLRSVKSRSIESGEIGLRYILRLLSDMDKNDIVYDMMMQPEHPSYIRFIEKGETTLPEYWEDDARSHNHDMMGHIYEWFYACVAGITSEDGFRTVRIAPRPPKALTTVDCSYHAATGKIEESMRMSDNGFTLDLTLPPNVTATVELPTAYADMRTLCDGIEVSGHGFEVCGGRHKITADK